MQKLTSNQILNYYKNAEKLSNPVEGKIAVIKKSWMNIDNGHKIEWFQAYKIKSVRGKDMKLVNDNRTLWLKKDERGYAKAFECDGKIKYSQKGIHNRDRFDLTFYDLEDGINCEIATMLNTGEAVAKLD